MTKPKIFYTETGFGVKEISKEAIKKNFKTLKHIAEQGRRVDKAEIITKLQLLIKEKYDKLESDYHVSVQFRDWFTCDMIKDDQKELMDLYNSLEKINE